MSVYVVKRKNQKPNEYICSTPTFEMAVEMYRSLENIDKRSNEYLPGRYGILQREYCPADEFDCDHYMMGICSLRQPEMCSKYKENN